MKNQVEGKQVDYLLKSGVRSRTANLSCEQVREIRQLHKDGMLMKDIAKEKGITPGNVSKIINKHTYTYC